MSVQAVSMRALAAATRCGAKPEVWNNVHALHAARAMVAVDTAHAHIAGHITGISDEGFTLAGTHKIAWSEALAVVGIAR